MHKIYSNKKTIYTSIHVYEELFIPILMLSSHTPNSRQDIIWLYSIIIYVYLYVSQHAQPKMFKCTHSETQHLKWYILSVHPFILHYGLLVPSNLAPGNRYTFKGAHPVCSSVHLFIMVGQSHLTLLQGVAVGILSLH